MLVSSTMSTNGLIAPVVFGSIAGGVGLTLYSYEVAILCGLIGYFLGNAIQSTVWAVTDVNSR